MKRKLLIIVTLSFLVFIFTACGTKEEDIKKVRVAYFPNLTHLQAMINIEEGIFQDFLGDEIKVEWRSFNSGNPEIESFFAGELDLGFIGPVPAINGHVRSAGEIVIIAGATNGGAILISGSEGAIENFADISGKKVAVPSFGNTQDFILRMVLEENGLSETTKGGSIEIIPVKNPDLKNYFSQKYIDAAFVPEPWGTQLASEIDAKIVSDFTDTWRNGDYPTTLVIARKDFVTKHPEIVKNFLQSHLTIINNYQTNKDDYIEKANKQMLEVTGAEINKEILSESLSRMLITWDPRTEAIIELAKSMEEHDFISSESDISNLFDFSILNELLQESGVANLVP